MIPRFDANTKALKNQDIRVNVKST